MAKRVRYDRILLIFVGLPLAVFFLVKWLFFSGDISQKVRFESQEKIHHEVRYNVSPQSFQKQAGLIINFMLESFERADFLLESPLDYVMLKIDDDTVLLPSKWHNINEKEHMLSGDLVFALPFLPDSFDFIVFDSEEEVVFSFFRNQSAPALDDLEDKH